jgi:hypothetical protein
MNMVVNEKEIEKSDRSIDLSGFKVQDELNPKIWDEDQKMKSDVRKTLLKIADDYFESLELPKVDIEDVTMTGSLANYNWSKYSDVDLHIVVDYDDIPVDEELVQDFLKSKSSNWNKEHDVTIYGYDVELYVQDINEPHHSTGVYSILKDEWVTKPKKQKISFNDKSVKEKSNRLMDRVEEIYDEMDEVDNEVTIKRVDKLTEKIKKMRQSGLETGGEFSVENIVFKVLRRNGMLDRLYDIKTVAYDNSVTLESTKLNTLIESMLDDSLSWIRDITPKTPIKKYPITKYQAHFDIVMDYFNSIPRELKYGDWKYSMDGHSGSILWSSPTIADFVFYATPYWEGISNELPIDYSGDMGDYDNLEILEIPNFGYKEDLINWLENEYPKLVSSTLNQRLTDFSTAYVEHRIKKGKLLELFSKKNMSKGELKKKFNNFLSKVKQEGGETKEAYKILVNSIKSGENLSKEEKDKVTEQLKDILKLVGFTVASILPGGILYLMLSKVDKFKKHLLPSSFLDETKDFDWVKDVKETDSWERVDFVVFNDQDGSRTPTILRQDFFETEKKDDGSIWVGDDYEIIDEFHILYPLNNFSSSAVSNLLGECYHHLKSGVIPSNSYVYNEELNKFEPNT